LKGVMLLNTGCRVMLSLMQLDIGGAETHVVELARELKKRGYYVVVTSNGGVYERELQRNGIKHYKIPLQNKNPFNVYKAFKLLKKVIVEEKIDIVHSHARIPSFILGKLQKKMKFPFVTTAHWVFTTKYGLKYITDWGQHAVAVSEDIKKYLMDNYKMPEENINVTINGIDTEKFSAGIDCSDIKKEFGIEDGDNVIVYVSRMDEDRSLAAKMLIEISDVLDKNIESLKIVIVGGGNDYDNVSRLARTYNAKVDRNMIQLAGARTDINMFAAMGDLFVGVSRAALEAMSCEKPVIIAGNEGYIGLFDEEKLDIGIKTNFCCRGCEETSKDKLRKDILNYFNMPEADKQILREYSRKLIVENYSVKRMVDDTVYAYEKVLN